MTRNNETDRERSGLTRRQFAALVLGLGATGGTAAILWSSRDTETGTTTESSSENPATPEHTDNDGGSRQNSEPATRTDAAGVSIVAPGDLPRALADATPHTLVQCASDVFEPSETLIIPPQVELDARGATIRPQHDGAAVRFAIDATMRGGTIDLGERNTTALQIYAGENGRFNLPVGPYGVTVRATPKSGAIGLRMAINSGKAMIAHQSPWIRCEGVSRPLVMKAKGPTQGNNFITSNDVYIEASNFETGISLIGENTLRKNRIVCNLIPGPATANETGILIDNPMAKQNWLEGTIHEPDRLNHVMAIERCDQPGENVYGSWLGHSFASPPAFVDRSKANDNRIVDFSGRPVSRSWVARSFQSRSSSTITTDGRIVPSVPTDDTSDPDSGFAVADPGQLQAALNRAASDGSNVVRARNGATFEPNNVFVPAGITFDARPATFRATPGNHALFRFGSGSRMLGGHVETSEGYGGSCFVIAANGGVIQNARGPLGTTIQGNNAGETALVVRAENGGIVRSCRTCFHARNIDYALEVDAKKGSKVVDNVFRVKDNKIRIGVRMGGNGLIADNNCLVHIQPEEDRSETGWLVSNPHAQNNWVQGWFWDGQHFENQHVVTINNGGGNVYPNFLAQGPSSSPRFFKFIDKTAEKSNYPISMADIEDGRRAREPFPADRLIAPSFDFSSFGDIDDGTARTSRR